MILRLAFSYLPDFRKQYFTFYFQLCGLFLLRLFDLICSAKNYAEFAVAFRATFSSVDLKKNSEIVQAWFQKVYGQNFGAAIKRKALSSNTYAHLMHKK